jgi:hypothetical protein
MTKQQEREFMAAFTEISIRIHQGEKLTRRQIKEICARTKAEGIGTATE